MLKSFFLEKKWRLWSWGGLFLLIISLWFQVQMTVAINTWYGKFYDLLQNAGDYVDKPQEGIQLFFSQLISLEYNNQRVEAAFRKDLVLGEDDKKNYAQTETLLELFTGIRFNYHRLYLHYGYFDGWMHTYDQFMIIAPYLIMGPGLFTGLITLGVMVQVSNAFSRVHGGFALFLHNWTTITELRSIWKRLSEFERNLDIYRIRLA